MLLTPRHLKFLIVQDLSKFAIISKSRIVFVDSYRDFLAYEIDVNRFMLYREECLPLEGYFCQHNDKLLAKIKRLEIELSGLDGQLAS